MMLSNGTICPSAAPAALLDEHGDALFAFAIRRVRRPELAEDLVQETLLAAIKAWDGFSGQSSTRTWLTGILRHKVADVLRARYREAATAGSVEDGQFDRRGRWKTAVRAWRTDPAVAAERSELRVALDRCVARLPVRLAHLFLSRVEERVDTQVLCGQLDITPENAWTMLHRARLRLRDCLTRHGFAAGGSG